ncbi:helix-turn-helix domain-containing protein [Streptomyces sp. NPDC046915]|uniref:TetR/AcrR family transcriptional regulator n=1 Tax=Streptomyces sp. NPDC046915 TaxID=3155257 RepID=UPI0033FC390C
MPLAQGGVARLGGRPPVSDAARREQREKISRVAVRLFRDQGVAGTSGLQIAKSAGVSERTLWRLFRSKESCVEPLLSKTLDAFRDVLRTWPAESDLGKHLRASYAFLPDDSRADIDAVLSVVRMSRDEAGLRAVWLVLQERAEPTFADVLAARFGLSPDSPKVRLAAASMNAALRVVTDDFAWAAASTMDTEELNRHRRRVANALRIPAHILSADD